MAKKAAAAKQSTAKKPAKKAAKAPAAASAAKDPPAAASKAAKSSTVTADEIGHAAGAVWQALQANGPVTMTALKKAVGLTGDLTMAGVGWLAREDKLLFDDSGRSVKVSLR